MVNRQSRKLSPLASAVRIAPLTAALAGGIASAATIPVTDSGGFQTDDSCTIVDAVNSINSGSVQAACTVTGIDPFGTNDTVDLTGFSDPTTIAFANVASDAALNLIKAAIIQGNLDNNGQPFVALSLDANSAPARLIRTSARLTVDSLMLTGGFIPSKAGGAIFSNAVGALTLTHAVVTGNSANIGGGIAVYNNVVNVSNSIVSGNYAYSFGGGIVCRSSCSAANIVDSTVSGNYAANGVGGGIYSRLNVVVTGSIVSGNHAASSGGGIAGSTFVSVSYTTVDGNRANQDGGGVQAKSLNISHSTISSNTAQGSGGGVRSQGVIVDNSTVSGNTARIYGGGIYTSQATFTSATISANRLIRPSGQNGAGVFMGNAIAFMSGTLIFGNRNTSKFGTTNASDFGGFATVSGDHNLVGTASPTVTLPDDTLRCNPQLAPLADNGGPTQTQALPFGSCAIDAGPADLGGTDQRGVGFARTVGPASDIGAFEEQIVDEIFKDGFESP